MRRRINLEQLSDKILVVLHEHFFNDKKDFVHFSIIRKELPSHPTNAIRLELEDLLTKRLVIQKTEMRSVSNAATVFTGVSAPPTRYEFEVEEYKLSRDGIHRVDKLADAKFEEILQELKSPAQEPRSQPLPDNDQPADEWEPLPIDREHPDVKDAIAKSEAALEQIEQNNGYAATKPDERNGIVEAIKGTLAAIKNGYPSRQVIITGLLAPLKFIAKTFSGAFTGEAAKAAVAAIMRWLGGAS